MIVRPLVLLLALVVGSTACSGSDDASGSVVDTATTVAPVVTDATTTTAVSTTTTSPATTSPATSAPPTTVPPTTAPPVTAPPPPLAGLVLSDTGLGAAAFGDDPDEVIDYVSSLLGSPTADTGWIDADAVALCPGDVFRGVDWGVFRLGFSDVSPFAVDRRHFMGWDYGIEGLLGEEPQGLITAKGVGLGAQVDELLDAYPQTQLFEGEEGLFPPGFFVNEHFDGFLTGISDTDIVTVMFGGYRCGE